MNTEEEARELVRRQVEQEPDLIKIWLVFDRTTELVRKIDFTGVKHVAHIVKDGGPCLTCPFRRNRDYKL